jgi:uncharacterized membrane protein
VNPTSNIRATIEYKTRSKWNDVLANDWIVWSYALFALSGLLWIVILVPIQVKQARMLKVAINNVPDEYHRLDKIWSVVGTIAILIPIPAIWMMIAKST